MTHDGTLWTIDELGDRAARALTVDYDGPPNGRVRDVPDLRTIRYYTTLGLLDRPAEMRGRTALYGRRHLMQIVAIKRLQAKGMSLAEIQQRLVGITQQALRRLARLPEIDEGDLPTGTKAERGFSSREGRFWAEAPAESNRGESESCARPGVSQEEIDLCEEPAKAGTPTAGIPTAGTPTTVQGVPLDEQVILLLTPSRLIQEKDISALRLAAAPLLELLQSRRLIRPRQERGNS